MKRFRAGLLAYAAMLPTLMLVASCGFKQVVKVSGNPSFAEEATRKNYECLKVVNGIETPSLDGVVLLMNAKSLQFCTGTFVSETTVITAAHCLSGVPNGGVGLNSGRLLPEKVVHGGITGDKAANSRPSVDLAVLIFKDKVATSWRKISSDVPRAGDSFTVVGFGQTDFINDNAPDGKLRYGFNSVDSISQELSIIRYSAPNASPNQRGAEAISGRGDSGGPLFFRNGLMGITSGGDFTASMMREEDFFLFSSNALTILEKAEAQGAIINGLNHIRRAIGAPEKPAAPDRDSISADPTSC